VTARFAYDEVPYDTEANPGAHPRAMATLATLFGLAPAAPSTARVLEIGCGDGEHLVAAASYLPRATFVGFDLAEAAIARGRGSARRSGIANVELLHRDVVAVGEQRATLGSSGADAPFDFVIAHGLYSWVPAVVRPHVLGVMRRALAPNGVGFLSVNARPGWELRRVLRTIMREAARDASEPAARVTAALAAASELARTTDFGFADALSRAAAEYLAHVAKATPPEAPFSRYVFHDLLADENEAFSIEELSAHAHASGLRIVCVTPLAPGRETIAEAAGAMARDGTPFLEVLVCRSDAGVRDAPNVAAVADMWLWADLAPAAGGAFRTTAGALLQTDANGPMARAARHAPGFVRIRELADSGGRDALARDLYTAARDGALAVATEPAPIAPASATPRVGAHVRRQADDAVRAGVTSAVLTSAMHASFRVPFAELAIVRELDGATEVNVVCERASATFATARDEHVPFAIARAAGDAARRKAVEQHATATIDRFARHGFFGTTEVP